MAMVTLTPKPTPWSVPKEWQGETAYIVAGGPSVKQQNLELLRGRRVIVVNSSYLAVPFADILFFGDARWYNEHRRQQTINSFKGRVVTCSAAVRGPNILGLTRVNPPPGFCEEPTKVASQRTNLQGAMNLAAHLGINRIVLLGADMGRAEDGTTHHHDAHPWKNAPGNACWDMQMEHLALIVEPLKARGIEVINTSSVSRIPWWPKKTLEEVVNECSTSN